MASLFEELKIGNMVARNRIIRAATAESLADGMGRPTDRLVDLYGELSRGGAGVVITGYAFVTPDGKPSEGALGMHDDALVGAYRALTGAVHAAGAKTIAQLVYGGSKSKLASDDPRRIASGDACEDERRAALEGLLEHGLRNVSRSVPNVRILGPSSIENPKTGLVPLTATPEDLARVVDAFGMAARRARECGFDGVEIHVAHGYLLSQFLDRRFNVRDDEYGVGLEGRARLALDCVKSVRTHVGAGFPVLVKINSCDDAADPQGLNGGLSEVESMRVAEWLVQSGADCIDVSGDWHACSSVGAEGPYFADFGSALARKIAAPVVVTGGWRSVDAIESHLAVDGIAGIAMSRPLICEPGLPARWLSGDRAPSACTGCGYCQKHPGIPCLLK